MTDANTSQPGSAWTHKDVGELIKTPHQHTLSYLTTTPPETRVPATVFGSIDEDEKASAYSDIVGILNSTGMPQIMASIEEVRQAGGKVDPLGQKGVEETLHAMEGQRQKQKDGQ